MTIKAFIGGLSAAFVLSTGSAQSAPVSLELMLLTDTSGSVSSTDYNLIRNGYAAAFEDNEVQQKILNSSTGSIAVAVSFFDSFYRGLGTAWTLIDSVASANAYAQTLRNMNRLGSGSTGLAAGITGAAASFAANDFESTRQVIDVTGDGNENVQCGQNETDCAAVQNARDAALAGETDVINALFVNDPPFFGDTGSENVDSILYGETNVIGGTGSFVVAASGFDDFERAIRAKIIREVAPPPNTVPVPAGLPLILTGVLGFAALKRRRSNKAA
ncbi:DUF1194 domain-containing protein [uncultured Roseobacter sp.]|uniref:DUF1194 domain-containing protein n=1 Tax=uncultured Roseobacter sp. TaxID=114847 RepID=UPI0026134978|nr:DUF1194 domain-containing protein [uncultured Roseobacter sp.]